MSATLRVMIFLSASSKLVWPVKTLLIWIFVLSIVSLRSLPFVGEKRGIVAEYPLLLALDVFMLSFPTLYMRL